MHLHGAHGFLLDGPVQRYYRDCKILEYGEGANEVQRERIANALMVDFTHDERRELVQVKAAVIEAAVIVGLTGFAATVSVSLFHLLMEKVLSGSIYGSADPWRELPTLAHLHARARLRLSELIGGGFSLDGVNDAMAELAEHCSPRPLVTFPSDSPWT